jgi:hypothetical protein
MWEGLKQTTISNQRKLLGIDMKRPTDYVTTNTVLLAGYCHSTKSRI